MGIFEAIMLLCFGAAWPSAIVKSWRARTARGKSTIFLVLVDIGYVCGMINKVLSGFDFVFFLYMLNFLMVAADLILTLRNRRLDAHADAARIC